jgi:hypothetical protein
VSSFASKSEESYSVTSIMASEYVAPSQSKSPQLVSQKTWLTSKALSCTSTHIASWMICPQSKHRSVTMLGLNPFVSHAGLTSIATATRLSITPALHYPHRCASCALQRNAKDVSLARASQSIMTWLTIYIQSSILHIQIMHSGECAQAFLRGRSFSQIPVRKEEAFIQADDDAG